MVDSNKPPPGCEPLEGGAVYQITDFKAFSDAIRPSIERNTALATDAEAERSGEGWSGSIFGFCPVQGEGHIDGLPWYFRARGEHWSFSVAATPDGDPVDALFDRGRGWSTTGEAEGTEAFAGSWMPYSEAWRHIEASIVAWRRREVPRG